MVNFTATSIVSDINYGLGLLASFGQNVDVIGIYANGGQNTVVQSGAPTSNIINSILGTTANTGAFGQMFANARPMKATIRETSRVMEHPVETGVILSDHHIINPVEIEIPMIVSSAFYAQTYSQIRQAFINATPLSVKTRVGVYSDMIVADMPHEEEADMYDVITIALRLKQVIYVVPGGGTLVNFQPADPLSSNTLASGLQQAASIGGSLLAAGTSVASYANLAKFL
jgi:hypothetical protein